MVVLSTLFIIMVMPLVGGGAPGGSKMVILCNAFQCACSTAMFSLSMPSPFLYTCRFIIFMFSLPLSLLPLHIKYEHVMLFSVLVLPPCFHFQQLLLFCTLASSLFPCFPVNLFFDVKLCQFQKFPRKLVKNKVARFSRFSTF